MGPCARKEKCAMLTLWNQFDDLFNDARWPARAAAPRTYVPAVDIQETKEGYVLTADVPGMSPEDVDISVEDGVLTFKGERSSEQRTNEAGYHRVERTMGSFQRSFSLPKGVNTEGIEAHVENGQLVIQVPKPVAALPKKIEVKPLGSSKKGFFGGEKKAG